MTTTAEIQPFDLYGPLPVGTTVLEASAGTGKTFAISALTARYVAEGTPIERILAVTFTRMATGELRDRVRRRLVGVHDALELAASGSAVSSEDEVIALLAHGSPEELRCRRDRLARALASFDAATITTTHGFCQQVLAGLGVDGDLERDVELVETLDDLIAESVDDVYVQALADEPEPPIPRSKALEIGREALLHPFVPILPTNAETGSPAELRALIAERVRAEVEIRKRRAGLLGYDDLLGRLRNTLADPERGDAACARLRERYSVALIDEFQDTDPVQWEIVRRAFLTGESTLVLIGDPKQAIYAFRGADVHAYLDAASAAERKATLDVNWRSDEDLLRAHDAVFGNARLGDPRIVYRPMRASERNRPPGLVGAAESAALRIRFVERDPHEVSLNQDGTVAKDSARAHIAEDLALDVARQLDSGTRVHPANRDRGDATGARPIAPGDIGVLVPRNADAERIRAALDEAGVPAVIGGAGSVFAGDAAREWLRLLEALERPSSRGAAGSVALTAFVGWSAERLAGADEADWDELHTMLHRWSGALRDRGVASLVEEIQRDTGLPERVLAHPGGERHITDMRHIAELLHAAARRGQLGTTALRAWLSERLAEARDEAPSEELTRRLDTDAEAVQVLTVHRSKGLEFPIVYCPYLWDPGYIPNRPGALPVAHDSGRGGERVLHVGGPGSPGFDECYETMTAEERGEELRLAYVALTRARHQVVVHWVGANQAQHASLARLLFGCDEDGNVAMEVGAIPSDEGALSRLGVLAAKAPGAIAIERTGGPETAPRAGRPEGAETLSTRRFARTLDRAWRRSSFSSIVAAREEPLVASEPEEPSRADEEPDATPPVGGDATGSGLASIPSPFADVPAGTEIGAIVHETLERVDFAAPDLETALADELRTRQAFHQVDIGDASVLATRLRTALETPLGGRVGDAALVGIPRSDRMDELGFELPLAGGDQARTDIAMAAIGRLLGQHVPPAHAFARYGERLMGPSLPATARGFLTGSIDLVVRLPGEDDAPSFALVDYKTNWLGPPGEALTLWHYRPEALDEAMLASDYPLQALLYLAALHRYLRWRLPGYDHDRHIAGVFYLFLRGMAGPETPVIDGNPCGVWAWRPPAALVSDLSDLLDAAAAAG